MNARRLPLVLGVTLSAALAACYDKSDYSPAAPLAEQVITLIAPSGALSLPADGFSRLRLEARLPGEPAFDKRSVIFATSNGTLDGGTAGTNCTGCRTVAADGTGRATIDLVSSQRVGSATVTAAPVSAPGIVASLLVNFVAAGPDDTLQFVAAPARAPADGATLTTFTVALSPSLPPGSRQVTFVASAGTFAPGGMASLQVNADAGGSASADLRSPREITTGRVTATVNGVSRETSLRFERALPDAITASVDMPVAPAAPATKIRVTATLLRNQGTVSDGTLVLFHAVRGDGSPVGFFTNVTATANGTAAADFLPSTTTPGLVTILIGVQDSGVTGSVQISLTGG